MLGWSELVSKPIAKLKEDQFHQSRKLEEALKDRTLLAVFCLERVWVASSQSAGDDIMTRVKRGTGRGKGGGFSQRSTMFPEVFFWHLALQYGSQRVKTCLYPLFPLGRQRGKWMERMLGLEGEDKSFATSPAILDTFVNFFQDSFLSS